MLTAVHQAKHITSLFHRSCSFTYLTKAFLYTVAIRHEIQDIEDGKLDRKINPLKVRENKNITRNFLSDRKVAVIGRFLRYA